MKALPKLLLIVHLILLTLKGYGQVLNGIAPFSAATPNLEPDGRKEIVKTGADEFVVLSKVKGGQGGDGEYSLEKYNGSLTNFYKVPVSLPYNEDVIELNYNDKELILFTVLHDEDLGESKLQAYGFNPASGSKTWNKTLMTQKVDPYQAVRARGSVEETFENAVCSGLNKNFVVPFQYQYQISYSPDRSKMIAYIFDYSKESMVATAQVFDRELNKINEGAVPIDNNFINYGIYLNNKGQVYILNVDRLGRIVVIQYHLNSRDNKLLDIQYASTQREGLKFHFHNDNEVYVGCVNTNNGKMAGVMYAKFDFEKNLVEKINFHDLSDGLLQTADAVRSGKFKNHENWMHYEITDFIVNKFEKVVMILEKREISALEYMYKSESVNDPATWKDRMGKVITESVFMVSFNANDELMWENYYAKSQNADLTTGAPSASFVLHADDESIRMVYASSNNATGVFNTYNYVEWDAMNGNKVKEMELQNDENLAMVRNYSIWLDDKVIVTGRKGLLGKKYMISSYKYSSGN